MSWVSALKFLYGITWVAILRNGEAGLLYDASAIIYPPCSIDGFKGQNDNSLEVTCRIFLPAVRL